MIFRAAVTMTLSALLLPPPWFCCHYCLCCDASAAAMPLLLPLLWCRCHCRCCYCCHAATAATLPLSALPRCCCYDTAATTAASGTMSLPLCRCDAAATMMPLQWCRNRCRNLQIMLRCGSYEKLWSVNFGLWHFLIWRSTVGGLSGRSCEKSSNRHVWNSNWEWV